MGSRQDLLDHVAEHRLVLVRKERRWRRAASRLAAQELLLRVLPGIYIAVADAVSVEVRCAAIMAWDPDAVITGMAAAKLSFWPTAEVGVIEVHSVRKKLAPGWIRLRRSRVPEEDIVERDGLRIARGSWVAVHLAATDNGAAIDELLREQRQASPDSGEHPDQLQGDDDAQTPHNSGEATLVHVRGAMERAKWRHGAPLRRQVVRDSRDIPWSQGERQVHKLMREWNVAGWVANQAVTANGRNYALDIVFPGLRLALEFDGWEYHGDREAFERDRSRNNDLVAHEDWKILHITWEMLDDPERLRAWILAAITSQLRALARSPRRFLKALSA